MLTNPVLISVVVMLVLCLTKMNVIVSMLIAGIVAGKLSGLGLLSTMSTFIGGMGANSELALSYVLLGSLAVAIANTGATDLLASKLGKVIGDRRFLFVIIIAFIASLSQNAVPVHIAFIPILIPPLINLMNELKLDRRGVACALTFGLKAPYIILPIGYGLQYHIAIQKGLVSNGLPVDVSAIWKPMLFPGIGMLIGLLVAVFITYRKPREYKIDEKVEESVKEEIKFNKDHFAAILGAMTAFIIQIITKSLPLGALAGLGVMLLLGAFKWRDSDGIISEGIKVMGFVAFVMLVAAGYAEVIRATNGVRILVDASAEIMGSNQFVAALIMLLVGLFVTMGMGSSFATVPILATVFVPLGLKLGFSTNAIIVLLGTAGALGDAGSPASDSTLGPTAGLNVDGQHDHIRDTCIPTFIHYTPALILMGLLGAMIM